ncbi:Hypothetical protein I595_1537 [Croceitalea dokdonensis DOKDO 023]|uniref:Lipoprotein n=1 Tax=Croceitalea dokdonensis DOKDO 023 TaxID=1300341 RepID=A0A0P7ATV7_9FLAO|nr:hypothetical protein [Croceitalea dokdonensis]KPM31889.1 Hypothetical protein I595_1537 [Croceitalea dokdonensis DOKDO 023]
MKNFFTVVVLLLFFSCKSYDIKQTEPITLKDGIQDIIEALNHAGDLKSNRYNGLVPAEFTVELNLSTSDKRSDSGSIEIAPASFIPKIGAGWSAEVNNSTGNKLTIKFKSILFAKQDEFLSSRSPDSIVKFYEKLKELNWNATMN